MSAADPFFNFPLAVLVGPISKPNVKPLECLEAALSFGMFNAGRGYFQKHGEEAFRERLEEECDRCELKGNHRPSINSNLSDILVGSSICKIDLGGDIAQSLKRNEDRLQGIPADPPFVRMAGRTLWAAIEQARADAGTDDPPERGISWREFRILAAILSVPVNRQGFAFIGWESIQARAHGFSCKESFRNRDKTPAHLAPPLTHKQIRDSTEALEDLGFYARFRLATGPRGGKMAYSFRHDREKLATAVCDFVNFRDRAKIRTNRAADVGKCLELLERAKSGQT